jgi:hypothetical protein
MEPDNTLDKFGKFLVEKCRDKGIYCTEQLLHARWKAPHLQSIQAELALLTQSQKEVVRKATILSIDSAIHDFLFALQERADFENDIQIIVDNKNIVEISDGIHGEPYSEEGWYTKFSKYETFD